MRLDDDKKEVAKRKIWLSLRLSLLQTRLTFDVIQEGMVCHLFCFFTLNHCFMSKDYLSLSVKIILMLMV